VGKRSRGALSTVGRDGENLVPQKRETHLMYIKNKAAPAILYTGPGYNSLYAYRAWPR